MDSMLYVCMCIYLAACVQYIVCTYTESPFYNVVRSVHVYTLVHIAVLYVCSIYVYIHIHTARYVCSICICICMYVEYTYMYFSLRIAV